VEFELKNKYCDMTDESGNKNCSENSCNTLKKEASLVQAGFCAQNYIETAHRSDRRQGL
jgi:hypothetical protein